MGHISKAVAGGALFWSELPQQIQIILDYAISQIPGWQSLPPDVQLATTYITGGLVAWGVGWVIYRIPNQARPAPVEA